MDLNQIFENLKRIADEYKGKNVTTLKYSEFYETLVKPHDGMILKLFDNRYYKKFNVGFKTVAKVLKDLNDETSYDCTAEPLDLKTFFERNETLLEIQGPNSVARKIQFLKEIFRTVRKEHHDILRDYYTRSICINFGTKMLIKMLIKHNPQFEEHITSSCESYTEFQLYRVYQEIKNNEFIKVVNRRYKPMLAGTKDLKTVLKSPCCVEPKLDGIRVLIRKKDACFQFWSRSGQLFNVENFLFAVHGLKPFLESLDHDVVLDGQLWVNNLPAGQAFRRLSTIILSKNKITTTELNFNYTIFDILELDDEVLLKKRHLQRRKILKTVLNGKLNENIKLIKSVKLKDETHLKKLLSFIKKKDLEGLVLKDVNSPYVPNKRDWVKIKYQDPTADVILRNPEMAKWGRHQDSLYSSFEVFVKKNKKEVSLGKVGSGFKDEDLILLKEHFVHEKEILVELRYNKLIVSQTNSSGYGLRFPRFVRLRQDLTQPNELDTLLSYQTYDL